MTVTQLQALDQFVDEITKLAKPMRIAAAIMRSTETKKLDVAFLLCVRFCGDASCS